MQIAEKRGGVRRIVAHVGSAHDEATLAVLMEVARERLHEGQQELDLGLTEQPLNDVRGPGGPVVLAPRSEVLWQVLTGVYATLEFDRLGDKAFKSMVLARIIEPASKLATIGVLEELGIKPPHRNTLHAALRRCAERDYRGQLATAAMAHSVRTSGRAAGGPRRVPARAARLRRQQGRDHHDRARPEGIRGPSG